MTRENEQLLRKHVLVGLCLAWGCAIASSLIAKALDPTAPDFLGIFLPLSLYVFAIWDLIAESPFPLWKARQ